MISEEDIRFIKNSDLIGKLIVAVDLGIRDIVTAEKDGQFLGVYALEGYSDRDIKAYRWAKGLGDPHWVVEAPAGQEVFHAIHTVINVEGFPPRTPDPEAQGKPFFEIEHEPPENVFPKRKSTHRYTILTFQRGPWLDHLAEIDRITLSDPEESEPYDVRERVRARFGVASA